MAELLETERSYVKDLESAVNCFLKPMQLEQKQQQQQRSSKGGQGQLPPMLRGKDAIVFANLEEILAFHKEIFLKELEKYETMPEDVGHCFVTWVNKRKIDFLIHELTVTACSNSLFSRM